jgi:hypothetical protein
MKVFGLKEISGQVNELLFKEVKFKTEPEKWNWVPSKPEKIRDLKAIVEHEKGLVDFACISNYAPTAEKQKVVLVFASGNLSYGFVTYMEQQGIKFFFLDYAQFMLQGEINISLAHQKQTRVLKMQDQVLDLADVSAVVWNPPKLLKPLFDFDHIPPKEKRNEFMFKKRWVQLLRELPLLLNKEVAWLPGTPFEGSQEWQNKLSEYNLALETGMHIPPVIFTNNLEELNNFCFEHGNNLVIREFSTPPFSFPPIRVNAKELTYDHFNSSPSCFQKYIDKQYELRIIVLFDKVYPCKIYSQDSELTKSDWRVYDDANVKWELVTIPDDLKSKLLSLSSKLKLSWCSIDMIYAPDNNYYFLEANRPGAHYWLEPFIGLDITREIVNELLARGLAECHSQNGDR